MTALVPLPGGPIVALPQPDSGEVARGPVYLLDVVPVGGAFIAPSGPHAGAPLYLHEVRQRAWGRIGVMQCGRCRLVWDFPEYGHRSSLDPRSIDEAQLRREGICKPRFPKPEPEPVEAEVVEAEVVAQVEAAVREIEAVAGLAAPASARLFSIYWYRLPGVPRERRFEVREWVLLPGGITEAGNQWWATSLKRARVQVPDGARNLRIGRERGEPYELVESWI